MDDNLQSFYGFARFPFGPMTESAQIFCAGSHSSLIDKIVAEVLAGGSILTVRGGRGVGKTTLARLIASRLEAQRLRIVQSVGASQSPLEIQRRIAEAGGYPAAGSLNPDHLLRALRSEQGVDRLVLLFDDADAVSTTMFRYLWLLTDLSQFGSTKIQFVLFGKMGPWAGLEHPDLERLRKAAVSRHIMFSLREDEALNYLNHKFAYAGQSLRQVMTKAAMAELLQRTQGIPAELDAWTERALVHGYLKGQRRITLTRLRRALPSDPCTTPPTVQIARPSRTAVAVATMMSVSVIAGATAVFVSHQIPMAGADRVLAAAKMTPAMSPLGQTATSLDVPSVAPLVPNSAVAAGQISAPATAKAATILPDMAPVQPSMQTAELNDLRPAPSPPADPAVSSGLPTAAYAPEPPGARPPTAVVASNMAASPVPSMPEAEASVDGPTPPTVPLEGLATTMEHVRVDPTTLPPLSGGGPGLVLVAGAGDDLATLYAKVYRGVKPPPYPTVIAANRMPVRPGALVIFPEPPEGWSQR